MYNFIVIKLHGHPKSPPLEILPSCYYFCLQNNVGRLVIETLSSSAAAAVALVLSLSAMCSSVIELFTVKRAMSMTPHSLARFRRICRLTDAVIGCSPASRCRFKILAAHVTKVAAGKLEPFPAFSTSPSINSASLCLSSNPWESGRARS